MRAAALVVLVLVALPATVDAQVAKQQEAIFPMAEGFADYLMVVSGRIVQADSPRIQSSAGFFRVDEAVTIQGLTRVCLPLPTGEDCIEGPLRLVVPAGSSFGFSSPSPYRASVQASHSLTTFVDLSEATGFPDRLDLGPSALMSLVDPSIRVTGVPATGPGSPATLTTLEETSRIEVHAVTGDQPLRTVRFDDPPLLLEGRPVFPAFGAQVVALPFENGASVSFRPAKEESAAEGLAEDRIELLDGILRDVRFLGDGALLAPRAILEKADAILSEVFNGAFIRARLGDDPNGLGDVGFAKFSELTVTDGQGTDLSFDGSYTLVAGDLGPSFDESEVASTSGLSLFWWTVILFVVAAIAIGAWLWLREGPVVATEPGPQHWIARVASAIGAIAMFLVWDWQLNRVLGSSILTTEGSGTGLGLLIAVELTSMLLAALLIGVPVYLAVRYGLAAARKPQLLSLSLTAAIFVTLGLGLLVLPALVELLFRLFS